MILILILAGIISGTGLLLYIHHRFSTPADDSAGTDATGTGDGQQCCGMHITCERDSLLAAVSEKIEYYDDEELDIYAGRAADAYSEEETDRFRDVLLSMRPEEIAGWARSLQLRGITLPAAVRDELILIVAEERARRTGNSANS